MLREGGKLCNIESLLLSTCLFQITLYDISLSLSPHFQMHNNIGIFCQARDNISQILKRYEKQSLHAAFHFSVFQKALCLYKCISICIFIYNFLNESLLCGFGNILPFVMFSLFLRLIFIFPL